MRSLIVRRGHRRAGVAGADDRVGLAVFDQIDRPADRRIFFPPHGFDRAVTHVHHLSRVHDLDPAVVAAVLLQLRLDLAAISPTRKSLLMWGYSRKAITAPATRLGGPKSPPIASKAIFMRGSILRLSRG